MSHHGRRAALLLAGAAIGLWGALPATSVHAQSSAQATFDQTMLTLINQDRAAAGVAPVQWNQTLAGIAESTQPYCAAAVGGRAQDMLAREYFSHTIPYCPEGNVFGILNEFGVPYTTAGENIGWLSGVMDPAAAAQSLNSMYMNSPEHRANILNPAFTAVGPGGAATAPGQGWSYPGSSSFQNVWISAEVFTGGGPTGPPPATPPAPAAGVAGTDSQLWATAGNGFVPLGGTLIAAPAIAWVPWLGGGGNHLYVVTGTDHDLWARTDDSGWQHLSSTPVSCLGNPAALVTGAPGSTVVTVACEGSDHGLYATTLPVNPGQVPATQGLGALGGRLTAGPAIAAVAGVITFFGVAPDGHIYARTYDYGFGQYPWTCIGHPAATSFGSMAYFGCHGSDGQLWYASNASNGWTSSVPAGGVLLDGPGVTTTGSGATFFVEGADRSVWHRAVAPTGPTSGWIPDGGTAQFGVGGGD